MSQISPETSPAPLPQGGDRDDALDGVRGLAVVMVLSIHLFVPTPDNAFLAFLRHVFHSMFIATDLFFVLSGFLITAILIRTRGRQGYFKSFYWRRALRITPAYALILLYAFVIMPAFFMTPELAEAVRSEGKWYLVYLQNFSIMLAGKAPAWLAPGHMWSLAVEEQFYMLWPLMIALVPTRHLQAFCVALMCFSIGLKLVMLAQHAHWVAVYVATPVRIEGLAAGGWIAARCALRGDTTPPVWARWVGWPATLALLVLIVWPYDGFKLYSSPQVVAHNVLASFVFAWMIYAILNAPEDSLLRDFFRQRLLIFLGTYSYGIYLIHNFVLFSLMPWAYINYGAVLPQNGLMLMLAGLTLAITIPLALLMFHLIEKPALGFKDWVRIGPRPRVAAAQPLADAG